jgi:hypothetical protein
MYQRTQISKLPLTNNNLISTQTEISRAESGMRAVTCQLSLYLNYCKLLRFTRITILFDTEMSDYLVEIFTFYCFWEFVLKNITGNIQYCCFIIDVTLFEYLGLRLEWAYSWKMFRTLFKQRGNMRGTEGRGLREEHLHAENWLHLFHEVKSE